MKYLEKLTYLFWWRYENRRICKLQWLTILYDTTK